MRISWGYKIFIAYATFAFGILFLAYKASHQNFDLVTENYYEAELKYQDVIDQKSRVAQLSETPKIQHTVNTISIRLPKEFAGKTVDGEVYLYRPSDATKDIRKLFSSATGFCELNLEKDLSGAYELKLSWKSEGKTFLHEQRIFF
jgi:nitrogen fixation protein FixH